MEKEYKEWLQEQTFETLAADNYNVKLLLLSEQAKNKELEDILKVLGGKTVAICEFDKPIEFWGAKDHLIASLQAKNKKLVEIINSIVKYCAKTDTIEWFDYDNIKAIGDEVNKCKITTSTL